MIDLPFGLAFIREYFLQELPIPLEPTIENTDEGSADRGILQNS